MSRKLVAAQIGCGAFSISQHGPNLTSNPHVSKIKWACDISLERAKEYAEKFNVQNTAASFEQVISDEEVDIICVATSHEAHVPIIEAASAHGKHVFCEKPMAMDEEQAYQIISAVRRGRIKLCVDYMRRMSPALVALKREYLKHKANPARQPWRYIETPRDKFVEESATDFLVRVQDESSSYRPVHLDAFKGGGLIIGEAVHWLDLACWLFDCDRPIEILAWGSPRMRYGIHLTFQSGNAATITFTPNGSFDYPKEFYEIAHDGALFRCEFYVENQYYGRPGADREIFPLQRDPFPDVGQEGGLAGYLKKHISRVSQSENARKGYASLKANHGYEEMFDGFIDSVINDTPSPCDEMAGYRDTYLASLAIKSIELAKPLPVAVDKWDYYVDI